MFVHMSTCAMCYMYPLIYNKFVICVNVFMFVYAELRAYVPRMYVLIYNKFIHMCVDLYIHFCEYMCECIHICVC